MKHGVTYRQIRYMSMYGDNIEYHLLLINENLFKRFTRCCVHYYFILKNINRQKYHKKSINVIFFLYGN